MDSQHRPSRTDKTDDHSSLEPGPRWPPSILRPLSDIREITEPSLMDMISRQSMHRAQQQHLRNGSKPSPLKRSESVKRNGSVKIKEPSKAERGRHERSRSFDNGSSSYSSTPEPSSYYSVPQTSVPRRTSSQNQAHTQRVGKPHVRKPSIRVIRPDETSIPPPAHAPAPLAKPSFTIPNQGRSQSPVKMVEARLDPITSDVARKVPSKTIVRSPAPADILEYPTYRHPRVKLDLQASAPLFVGGGSVEGHVKITIDDNECVKHRRSLGIASLSVDLLGFEEVGGNRRSVFLTLGTELMDAAHPPPTNMVEPPTFLIPGDKFWMLRPSTSALPFMISLPLDTGPPPFQSKHANIRFLLCATATIKDAYKHYRVRVSHDISVLSTYDPEKALKSLSSPLTASDELQVQRWGVGERLKLTAGLHRQVWVSGSSIFADVHISNKTRKPLKRLELTLERDILCYRHSAPLTTEKSSRDARIFESNDRTILAKTALRQGSDGWNTVEAYSSDTRTCELELPRGHATVRCGKHFEVRYFLNVTASLSNSKSVSVQLPIILVHMNSLDVVPNSVAQVAAAIEQKRAHQRQRSVPPRSGRSQGRERAVSSPARTHISRKPSYVQGRAFAAPRQQSLDRRKAEEADLNEIQHIIDTSPRRPDRPQQLQGVYIHRNGSNISFGAVSASGTSTAGSSSPFGGLAFRNTPPTPPPPPKMHHVEHESQQQEVRGLRDRLQRMRSFDSIHSKNSISRMRSQRAAAADQNVAPPKPPENVRRFEIAPHTLGLTATEDPAIVPLVTMSGNTAVEDVQRAATATSFREKLDRSRFEFKAVRRKASGGLKERSRAWLENVRLKDRDRDVDDGWI